MSIRFFRKSGIACAEEKQISGRRLSNSRFSSIWRSLRKLLQFFLIAVRAVLWLFFGPSKRRFAKFRARFEYGGLRACWCHAIERFSELSTQYSLLYNQLSFPQSKFLLSMYSDSPLISVIIPVYNAKLKWLKNCVESVINQHYTNLEIIMADVSEKPEIESSMNVLASKDSRAYAYFLKEN